MSKSNETLLLDYFHCLIVEGKIKTVCCFYLTRMKPRSAVLL